MPRAELVVILAFVIAAAAGTVALAALFADRVSAPLLAGAPFIALAAAAVLRFWGRRS